ncbi:hypothetical protein SLEP1_g54260 [Rubroshorea leprosula]|uniref:Putative plant transposon protein domain-containing protein n=1 Tax=Rubroshorea leprosula TaxID=152421 RepID=A0AAV5MDT5_9ROSI|nr:hypothetical protein SLEP1_g54260 [Rubroshorea leprosula]
MPRRKTLVRKSSKKGTRSESIPSISPRRLSPDSPELFEDVSMEPITGIYLRDPISVEAFTKIYAKKKILSGHCISPVILNDQSLRIKSWLEGMGWLEFATLNCRSYPRLVKEFYTNYRYSDSSDSTSYVRGKHVVFKAAHINELFNLPHDEISLSFDKSKMPVTKKIVFGNSVSPTDKIHLHHFSADTRLLLWFVTKILCPRQGSHGRFTKENLYMMGLIMQGNKLNLGALIISHMRKAMNSSEEYLPYGHLLTNFFEKWGIDLSKEQSEEISEDETLTETALKRMKFEKQDGTWVRIGDSPEVEGSLGKVLANIDLLSIQIEAELSSKFAAFEAKMTNHFSMLESSLNNKLNQLEKSVAALTKSNKRKCPS